jgi:hypothetical protein
MGKDVARLSPHSRHYPDDGDICSLFHSNYIIKDGKGAKLKMASKEVMEERLNHLISKCLTSTQISLYERWEIEAIDCYLYSPMNKNKGVTTKRENDLRK